MIKKILSVYGVTYLLLLTLVMVLQFAYPKLELHMLLNAHHNSIQDAFFTYYTQLAEWPLYVLALLPLLWKKVYITGFFALCELTGGAILQILKHTINMERPICAFENCQTMVLPLVDGINMHHSNSFPSGHASTFFVFCTCCALLMAYRFTLREQSGKRWLLYGASMLGLLLLATLGAYSRVYLSQHFLSDICMGSVIGFTTPILMSYYIGHKIIKPKQQEAQPTE
jgi:membrane-associated phospholipid phosphatase